MSLIERLRAEDTGTAQTLTIEGPRSKRALWRRSPCNLPSLESEAIAAAAYASVFSFLLKYFVKYYI